ncbi:hypothetical protein [Shewanella salipaludis]|uniref:Uncharacterized protein n=1 Tax=Shewanella salipaludis TaxID=2723052 RepID=A0A972FWB0_9GAMM|nr:hypothetical protein [Shewanella salipaludis]NMH66439.1 hypothetical protein [Shewanella salipaludis]
MKPLLPLLLFMTLAGFSSPGIAADEPVDYSLHGAIYAWYGQLDLGTTPEQLITKDSQLDFAEYPQGKPTVGAHHILSIEPLPSEDGLRRVEVTLEYLPWDPDNLEGNGHYLIQELSLTQDTLLVRSSQTTLDEVDDFISSYREASDHNLIRALIYRWTQTLDNPGRNSLQAMLSANASFQSPEAGIDEPAAYLAWLQAREDKQSRRVIKNLAITPLAPQEYQAQFEYQWTAINPQGETELAQVAVELRLRVHNGIAIITGYRERYLPPVTDLGAEIRC